MRPVVDGAGRSRFAGDRPAVGGTDSRHTGPGSCRKYTQPSEAAAAMAAAGEWFRLSSGRHSNTRVNCVGKGRKGHGGVVRARENDETRGGER